MYNDYKNLPYHMCYPVCFTFQVKAAQNSLLKEKNAQTVVEGELAHNKNSLATMLQDQSQKISTDLSSPAAKKPKVICDDEAIKHTLEDDKSTTMEVAGSTEVDSTVVVQVVPTEEKSVQDTRTVTNSKLIGAKLQPGQKISNVIERLVQDQQSNAANINTSEVEEKGKRKSLDAVVAQLHVVKNQELDKMFCVDLGSTKIVRENSKLDSVVEKLAAKQNQPQMFPTSFLVDHEDSVKTSDASVSSVMHTEADTSVDSSSTEKVIKHLSSRAEDINNKMEFDSASGFEEGKVVRNAKDYDGKLCKQNEVSAAVCSDQLVDKEEWNTSSVLATGDDGMYMSTEHETTSDSSYKNNAQKLTSPGRKVTVKVLAVANQGPTPSESAVSCSSKQIVSSSGKNVLAKVTNNLTQKYQMKSVDLELLLEHDESSDDLVHVTCDGLTEYCAARVYTLEHQNTVVPDVVFTELLQVQEYYHVLIL